jgi:hypothetical protein
MPTSQIEFVLEIALGVAIGIKAVPFVEKAIAEYERIRNALPAPLRTAMLIFLWLAVLAFVFTNYEPSRR